VALSLVCPEDAWLLVEIEKLLKRQIPRVADTGYEPVSLKVNEAPKKNAPHKTTGKKDLRHTKKPDARGTKPAQSDQRKPRGDKPAQGDQRKSRSDKPAQGDQRKSRSDKPAQSDQRKPRSDKPAQGDQRKPHGDKRRVNK
jgi:hypothetical protein